MGGHFERSQSWRVAEIVEKVDELSFGYAQLSEYKVEKLKILK